jgi:Protein of unknown function (DUF1217)
MPGNEARSLRVKTMTSTTLSTYTSYLIVNRDMKSSLDRVANQGTVARDTEYYEANIDKVTTADEFVDDYRLYSYAMKAYGLEEMTYGKAFMKKVLESDLSDTASFANSLTDKRYATMAAAFNFGTKTAEAQTSVQEDNLVKAYQDSFDQEEKDIQSEVDYYSKAIANITDVDDLLSNSRLKTYVLDSFGLDAKYTSTSYLKQVLTSDLEDPNSFANQTGSDKFVALAEAFNFQADGTVADGDSAQTSGQIESLRLDYVYNKSTFPSDTLAAANQTYWETNIASMTSVDELVDDPRMVEYLTTAFSVKVQFTSTIRSLLTSDSAAATLGYTGVKAMFNFQSDGSIATGETAQNQTQLASTSTSYQTAFKANQEDAVTNAVTNYQTRIAEVKSVDNFLSSNKDDDDDTNDDVTEIWDVALRAYGIDPADVSKSRLKDILASDPNDPKSYVNQLKDDRYVNLVKAFNFDAEGDIDTPLLVQSASVISNFATDYKTEQLKLLKGSAREKAEEAADKEIDYYNTQMQTITTAAELIADDRLVSFVLESKGIDPKSVTKDELKNMFSSDLDNPKSYVNSLANGVFAEIVASFNFDSEGNLSAQPVGTIQQRGDVLATVNNYKQQTLEEQEGESNEGVRLALYFERKAADVTSAYTILGDTALFEFFKTTFSMSDYISNMDTDQQASMIEKYVDISKLQDPDYVTKLIKQYTALYDSENSSTTSPALTLLTTTGTTRISSDTLLAVAQLSSK